MQRHDERRAEAGDAVVITGSSAWTCFGRGVDRLLRAIEEGRREPKQVLGFDTSDPWFLTREAMQVPPEPTIRSALDDTTRPVDPQSWSLNLAVETALDAIVDAGRPHAEIAARRMGVLVGSSHGTNHGMIEHLERGLAGETPDPELLAETPSLAPHAIALRLATCGPAIALNTACSAGANAIGQAWHMLLDGRIDCAVAGGYDTFSRLSFTGFNSLRALDPQGCRPFDVSRAGLSLGDGAAFFVLEREADARARGATILGRLTGYGCGGEAYHPTAPNPEGAGIFAAMRQALATDRAPEELTLVSAHGTGTPANDAAEANAIERLCLAIPAREVVQVASLKSQTGHSLGAAGAVQAVAALACARAGIRPATIGLRQPIDHGPRISFPQAPGRGPVPLALCNALGFAGSVAALALRPFPSER